MSTASTSMGSGSTIPHEITGKMESKNDDADKCTITSVYDGFEYIMVCILS